MVEGPVVNTSRIDHTSFRRVVKTALGPDSDKNRNFGLATRQRLFIFDNSRYLVYLDRNLEYWAAILDLKKNHFPRK